MVIRFSWTARPFGPAVQAGDRLRVMRWPGPKMTICAQPYISGILQRFLALSGADAVAVNGPLR
jgi:hypothetical protein